MAESKQAFDVLVLPGDGIGLEVTEEAVKVLKATGQLHGLTFEMKTALVGGAAIDAEGAPVSEETIKLAADADAVLLGAVGGTKWDDLPTDKRPEKGLLGMRKVLDLFANLRPVQVFGPLAEASTLKPEVVKGIDLLVVRELVSDLYFGEPRGIRDTPNGREGYNTMRYLDWEVERVARKAFSLSARSEAEGHIHSNICCAQIRAWLSCKDGYVEELHLTETKLGSETSPVAVSCEPDVLCCYAAKINSGIVCIIDRTRRPGKLMSST